MPKLGLTMTEGTVAEWSIAPGAEFRAGDTLMVIESDKVAVEVPAERDGVLLEVTAKVGDVVSVGSVVGYVAAPCTQTDTPELSVAGAPASPPPRSPAASTVVAPVAAPTVAIPKREGRIVATPLAKRLAQTLSVDLHAVAGTGPRGRIRADDVKAAAECGDSRADGSSPTAVQATPSDMSGSTVSIDTLAKPTSIQTTMARRLTAAKQQIPHFYLAAEAEVSRLLAARAEINASKPAVKLTLNHLVVAAVARAMRDLPQANRVWTDEGIRTFDTVDVGVAVNAERGLIVPVVRDIGRASVAEIAARATEAVDRARQGTLKPTDVVGGAITVSNAGMHEVTWMTPIINPGTAMILGVGSIREIFRPDADGRPVLAREMGLVLAADHRLVDGVAGLTILNRVIAHLRNPLPMLFG